MIQRNTNFGPSRAGQVNLIDDPNSEIEADVSTASRAAVRRRRGSKLGRGLVATVLGALLASGTLVGYAFTQSGSHEDQVSEHVAVDVAIPAAAVDAAENGFANRAEDASRNAVRANLSEAVAGETSKDRDAAIEQSISGAISAMASESAAERDSKMDADLKLVEAQAAQLKKEAEEAAARLEAARLEAEAAANGTAASGSTGTASSADIAAVSSKGGSMPVKQNYRVGAGFGATGSWSRYHTGQDFPAPVGTPIYAVASGIVLSPTSGSWAGTNVVIQHANGGATLYAHMSRRVASTGEAVKAGQLIGYVGETGRAFGPHLHMEYYAPGVTPGDVYRASNPLTFLRSLGVKVG